MNFTNVANDVSMICAAPWEWNLGTKCVSLMAALPQWPLDDSLDLRHQASVWNILIPVVNKAHYWGYDIRYCAPVILHDLVTSNELYHALGLSWRSGFLATEIEARKTWEDCIGRDVQECRFAHISPFDKDAWKKGVNDSILLPTSVTGWPTINIIKAPNFDLTCC